MKFFEEVFDIPKDHCLERIAETFARDNIPVDFDQDLSFEEIVYIIDSCSTPHCAVHKETFQIAFIREKVGTGEVEETRQKVFELTSDNLSYHAEFNRVYNERYGSKV